MKKIFNAEVSRGVKIVVTVVLVVILLLGTNLQSSTMKPVKVEQRLEDAYFSDFMLRLNNVIESKDYGSLKQMLEEGVIAREVFDDISSLMGNVLSKGDFTIYLKPQNQQFYEDKARVDTSVIIKSMGVEKASGVVCLFEKSERGWMLSAITPKLTDIKLSRSFEEEAEYKLKQTPKPTDKLLEEASAIASQKEAYLKEYLKG